MFWDYSSTKMDLNRRVCLPFALIWGPLAAVTVRYIHPLLRPWLNAVPPWLTLAAWLLLTADSFFTVRLLLQYHDIDLLSWKNLLRRRAAGRQRVVQVDIDFQPSAQTAICSTSSAERSILRSAAAPAPAAAEAGVCIPPGRPAVHLHR